MKPSWDRADLRQLPAHGEVLYKGDERIAPYRGDVAIQRDPDAVIRARDVQEVQEVLAFCHAGKIPVTFAGGFTGLTGAATAEEGLLIATEQCERILDIQKGEEGRGAAIVQPGIFLGDLKEQVVGENLFYPPDPTSFREARLGGTVATNAKGEDAVLYGDTRRYILGLKIIQADGTLLDLNRPQDDEAIDLLVSSEGTLGYLAEVTVQLLPLPPEHWAGIAFFPSLESAIRFGLESLHSKKIAPRALELLDRASLAIWSDHSDIPEIPESAMAAIYWKQEFKKGADEKATLDAWIQLLEKTLSSVSRPELAEATWFARTDAEKNRFRRWRHLIPEKINERLQAYRAAGGGKVASDWRVPLDKIERAIHQAITEADEAGLEIITFGHLGEGHPHLHLIAHNQSEYEKARKFLRRQCERAVKWNGVVAGEHGFGKLFRDFLLIQYTAKEIERMRGVKRRFDPHWILGRGTLFTGDPSLRSG